MVLQIMSQYLKHQLVVKKTVDLGKGFVKNSKIYTLELTNGDELPYGVYLVGEGRINTY